MSEQFAADSAESQAPSDVHNGNEDSDKDIVPSDDALSTAGDDVGFIGFDMNAGGDGHYIDMLSSGNAYEMTEEDENLARMQGARPRRGGVRTTHSSGDITGAMRPPSTAVNATSAPRHMTTRSMARSNRNVLNSSADISDDIEVNLFESNGMPEPNILMASNGNQESNGGQDDVEMEYYFDGPSDSAMSDSESDNNADEEDDDEPLENSDHDDIVDLDDNDIDYVDNDDDGNLEDVDDEVDMILDVDLFDDCIDVSKDVQEIMNKPKPNYTFNLTDQIARRERGCALNFHAKLYASRYAVERMACSTYLKKHRGCVNSLNFSRCGSLLCSGSDDANIIIWDWAKSAVKHVFRSGHTENIFATKFISTNGCLDIVSSSLDGNVRRSFITPSGGKVSRSILYSHRGPVNKIVISPFSQYEIISAGEDGLLMHKDIRIKGNAEHTLNVTRSLYSVDHHPYAPEICTSGTDNLLRIYDKRKMNGTVHEMCPKEIAEKTTLSITSCVYNYDGTQVLASYSGQSIYLFNNRSYVPGEHMRHYRGHVNKQTIKGVNFFGPHSEYVISGSDCGNLFFWDKDTEAIINYMRGDFSGVVNCLEPHPSIPVLAISGLDHSVKIMSPQAKITNPPDLSKLAALVEGNLRRGLNSYGPGTDRRLFAYIMRRMIRRNVRTFDFDGDSRNNLDYEVAQTVGENAAAVVAALEEGTPFDYWADPFPDNQDDELEEDEEEEEEEEESAESEDDAEIETDSVADIELDPDAAIPNARDNMNDVRRSSSVDFDNFECHTQ